MYSLTESDKKLIEENGGIIVSDGCEIRFKKSNKPKPACKKRLKELGYKITNYSNARFFPEMVFVLRE